MTVEGNPGAINALSTTPSQRGGHCGEWYDQLREMDRYLNDRKHRDACLHQLAQPDIKCPIDKGRERRRIARWD